ncbi:hypothetical protein LCGC14_0094290 [marine sediment metagenome]|uniref:Uncharacterized protein n=1 Tax=marine sediment metagenome TaxID=412755 RepID=A0A0F9VHH1_9ZZZZ|nr:hypothetical protein [Phycisphaerae bacterium]HDZ45209.1 hypothetical protein [Phycisphaerae bacterium]
MPQDRFYFILTVMTPEVDTPYEIVAGHHLQKATAEQIERIKPLLDAFAPGPPLDPQIKDMIQPSRYEFNCVEKRDSAGTSTTLAYEGLPKGDWRYWIISFEGPNSEATDLGYALSLMAHDIELGFHLLEGGFAYQPLEMSTFLGDAARRSYLPRTVSKEDLDLAAHCYAKLKELPKKYKHIVRGFRRFKSLRCLPSYSELVTIGLFSIIESLLTHAPKTTEGSDSLTHQLKYKIPLVRRRCTRTVDNQKFFGSLNEEKLWKKLYGYRSQIVHGETGTVASGDKQILKGKDNIDCFLREIVKLLLIQALEEPVLMTDLKEC